MLAAFIPTWITKGFVFCVMIFWQTMSKKCMKRYTMSSILIHGMLFIFNLSLFVHVFYIFLIIRKYLPFSIGFVVHVLYLQYILRSTNLYFLVDYKQLCSVHEFDKKKWLPQLSHQLFPPIYSLPSIQCFTMYGFSEKWLDVNTK